MYWVIYLGSEPELFPNDPGKFPEYISNEMLCYIIQNGPCQPLPWELPSKMFPKTKDVHGKLRCFHQSYYYKLVPNNSPVKRTWLSYSPSLDKVFCISCKLFGLTKAKKLLLANEGSNDWKNLNRNLNIHSHCTEHLQAEISRSLFSKNIRIDLELRHSRHAYISENREIVRIIIKVLILAARQNIALRGHDETTSSQNQGKINSCHF